MAHAGGLAASVSPDGGDAAILAQIGPAVSSGNSFLIYGQPGNGKTFLAEALMNMDDSCVYVPHALDCQGTIVQVFDPLYHQPVDDTEEQSVFAPGRSMTAAGSSAGDRSSSRAAS